MSKIQSIFEESLKNYNGTKAKLLSVNDFTLRLKQELPGYFIDWMNPEHTGEDALEPIARIGIEVDDLADVYTGLYSEKGRCMVSEGACPDLYDWGLADFFEEEPKLASQFLALCYEKTLVEACKTPEFLSLPRSEKIIFSVGQHAGWECDELYIYKGKRNEIDHGNVCLKRLHLQSSCYTKPGTIERKFMEHLKNIDVQKCSDELSQVFEKFLNWLFEQNTEPLEDITIAWSSNFEKEAAFGGCKDVGGYRWPESFDFSKWFATERPKDLDQDDMTSVRYCVSNKIAEIACLASEKLVEMEVFKRIPKKDNFFMKVINRTAGVPPKFYPFR